MAATSDLTIIGARWDYIQNDGEIAPPGAIGGHPVLLLDLAGQEQVRISFPQKFIYYGFPAVFLGAAWERRLPPVEFPGDEANGLSPLTLLGCTQDPTIVRLTIDFNQAVREGAGVGVEPVGFILMLGDGAGCDLGDFGANVVDGVVEDFGADEGFDGVEDFGLGHEVEVAGEAVVPASAVFDELLIGEVGAEFGEAVFEAPVGDAIVHIVSACLGPERRWW